MNRYRVTSHVTICVEMDIMANCPDDANIEFNKQLEEAFGWVDYDSVEIEKIGDGE